MERETPVLAVLCLLVVVGQLPSVAAHSTDSTYPEAIQDIECPDYHDVAFNESLNRSDVTDCEIEDYTRLAKRGVWDATMNIHGIGNWMAETGEGMRNSTLPILPGFGKQLEAQGESVLDRVHASQRDILAG